MSIVFQPTRIGNLEVKNRLVRSATAERMVDDQGGVTDGLVKCYEQLAKGGVGTIITGHSFVREDGRSGLQMMGIYHDDLIPGLKRLAKTAHQYEAKIFVQLNHVGRHAPGGIINQNPLTPSVTEEANGATAEASASTSTPSSVPRGSAEPSRPKREGMYPPREMTSKDIKEVIQSFGQTAERAREAGFDGVQIHAAHGYLISQFLSPHTNKRKDEWGGDINNRLRFLSEVFKTIRERLGEDFPIWIKMNCEDFIESGLALEESLFVAAQLEKCGINAIEISGGVVLNTVIRPQVGKEEPEAYFLPQAEQFRSKLKVPLILVGGIRSLTTMEMLIKDKGFDLVSMSRPIIREPDLPNKLQKKTATKSTCISCNTCLRQRTKPIKCRVEEKIKLRIK